MQIQSTMFVQALQFINDVGEAISSCLSFVVSVLIPILMVVYAIMTLYFLLVAVFPIAIAFPAAIVLGGIAGVALYVVTAKPAWSAKLRSSF